MARALPSDGRLVTIEVDPAHAEVAQRSFDRAGVAARVEIRLGAALQILPQLAGDGTEPFDMVFIDADKGNYASYLDWAIRLARPGTLIVADNVVRDGEVIDERSDDPSVQGARRFMAALGADPRVIATSLQTVGVKGYDGLAFAIVTAADGG
jgi:caffeoyl-CoA O-methyltransferase